ncbi:hypothetical protein E2986_12044 [Frieseomelitta varia]|uniref:Uncharacterized protein n=1 Tax=Frieseomelitta varia TaxID=561572 RepID=A0A833VKP1_9HYME|nr:hypothetical protein E2986_12044 [Frieseomelitta varia]
MSMLPLSLTKYQNFNDLGRFRLSLLQFKLKFYLNVTIRQITNAEKCDLYESIIIIRLKYVLIAAAVCTKAGKSK